MEKYTQRHNVIFRIMKAHYNIVKINVNPLMLTVTISMELQWGPLMCDRYKGAINANLWFF